MSAQANQQNVSIPSPAENSWARVIALASIVTLAVVYQLYRTASLTGNYEGFWFSLVHTFLVAAGVVCALRPERVQDSGYPSH